MTQARLLLLMTLIILLATPTPAPAWNNTGHMLVAEIAYRQLGFAERAKAVKILNDAFADGPEGLAQFETDIPHGMPAQATAAERDHYTFLKAATWPDIIRDESHPLHNEFHKPAWHFINLPFAPPGDEITLPPAPTPTPAGAEPKDVIAAMRLAAIRCDRKSSVHAGDPACMTKSNPIMFTSHP